MARTPVGHLIGYETEQKGIASGHLGLILIVES